MRRRAGIGAAVVLVALGSAAPAAAAPPDPAPGTAAWQQREVANFAASRQRTADRAAQPQTLAADSDPLRDPAVWAPARGAVLVTSFPNRYRASLALTLHRPSGDVPRPLATVVVLPGLGGSQPQVRWLAQDLAEHGYLAVTLDPQGAGGSDAAGAPEYCEPGAWQQPQEMGITEQGACAGQDPAGAPSLAEELLVVSGSVTGAPSDYTNIARTYRELAPRFVFAALDAATWLTSDANPWRAWVDAGRLGLAGHSVGAYAAAQAANGDPRRRFKAAVALDPYHPVDHDVRPAVPTLWLQSEQETAPRLAPPQDPENLHPARASLAAFRAAGVPAGMLVLRSSTHADFVDGAVPASRNGQRVAAHDALAWFDRFLRDDRRGTGRLFAPTLDGSADASSIGTGTLDASGRNVPVKVAGIARPDTLSYYHPSVLALFGGDCRDLRLVPCALPAPVLAARVVRRTPRRIVVALRLRAGDVPRATVRVRSGRRVLARAGRRVDLGHGQEVVVRLRRARTGGPRHATLVVEADGLRSARRVRVR